MLAIGCLFPVLFALGGMVLGALMDGQQGSIWGGALGLAIGLAVPAAWLYVLAAARKRNH
ncbi:hypothetical protein EAH79_17230 [Sphingomonas koreensis]|nr:hypothetical protein EAH79_17230 [Sphingomonas koreensis]